MIPKSIKMTFEQIPNKPKKMKEIIARAIAYAADRIEIEAKAEVPVRTGRLQSSIQQGTLSDGRWVGPDTEYDIYVEMGTSRMSAQPYLRPAVTKTRKLISAFMARQYKTLMIPKKVR